MKTLCSSDQAAFTIEALDGFAKPPNIDTPVARIAAGQAGFFHHMEKHMTWPHIRSHRATAEKHHDHR
jgi:hypothetical protein